MAGRAAAPATDQLADCVPNSTRVFVHVHRPAELNRVLRDARALQTISSMLSGRLPDRDFDVESLFATMLGDRSPIPAADLVKCEVALASDSWAQLVDPMLLVRAPDEAMIRRWFPQYTEPGLDSGAARVFRTEDRRFVCVRDLIVAVAPRTSDWAQLGSVLRTMAGTESDVLGRSATYRELVAYLPARSLATIYHAGSEEAGGSSTAEHVAVAGRMAIGVYARGNVIDLAIRGASHQKPGTNFVSPESIERMLKLPETTLGALLTTVDWDAMARQAGDGPVNTIQRYVRLLMELGRADAGPGKEVPQLGRHLILVWGEDFSSQGGVPQLGAMIESEDAGFLPRYARRVADSLGRVISTLELRDVSGELKVEESRHLGVEIASVSLKKFADGSRFGWVKLLAPLEISWAASGSWFVVTLTREHLHRILDAQIGFVANLSDHREARGLREGPGKNVSIAFLQGTQAAATLHRWEEKLRGVDMANLFAGVWDAPNPEDRDRLGIDFSEVAHFGMVEVEAVTPSTPADRKLQPGDRIFGVDGRLLQMASPVDDLQRWWEESEPGSSHTLRVLRGELVIELEVSRRFDEVTIESLLSRPIDLLKEVAVLCEAVPFSTLYVHHTGDRYTSARLSMRVRAGE